MAWMRLRVRVAPGPHIISGLMPGFKVMRKIDETEEKRMKQLQYFQKKCGFTEKEAAWIMNISKKVNLEPQRVIETIGVNSPKGKLNKESIDSLLISIPQVEKEIKEKERKLKELESEKGKKETKGKGILSKLFGGDEEVIKSEIEHEKRKLNRFKNILTILTEFEKSGMPEIAEKIHDKTNYRPKEELWY